MHYIALLPGVICAWLLSSWGIERTFLYFFVPIVVALPDYYKALIAGFPDLSFSQGMMIPITAAVLLRYGGRWKPRLMDVLVILLATMSILSELQASGYADAQNYVMDMLTYIIGPYVLGRLLIEQSDIRIEFVKQVVGWACFVVLAIMVYEWRFAVNPYQMLLNRFFPGQGDGWVVTFRFGMTRAAGPYAHAILAGVLFGVYYRLQRWLMWEKHWPAKWERYPNHPYAWDMWLWAIIGFGVFANGAKGPWLGAILAAVLVTASRVPFRGMYLKALLAATLIIGIPASVQFWDYVSVGRGAAKSENQETAAYRKELIDHYWQYAKSKALLGWGKTKVPKVPGSESVDNYFLLLSLMHGLVASSTLLTMFGMMIVRLWRRANLESTLYKNSNPIAWTLFGIFVIYFISLATVYMAYQVMLIFFLFLGWTETILQQGPQPPVRRDSSGADGPYPFEDHPAPRRFRRVLT